MNKVNASKLQSVQVAFPNAACFFTTSICLQTHLGYFRSPELSVPFPLALIHTKLCLDYQIPAGADGVDSCKVLICPCTAEASTLKEVAVRPAAAVIRAGCTTAPTHSLLSVAV